MTTRQTPEEYQGAHDDVKQLLDPQGRGRQHLASQLEKLPGTRMADFVLTRQAPAGKWGAATYALKKTGVGEMHRGHREHTAVRADDQPVHGSDAPYPPYAHDHRSGNERSI